MSAIVESYMRWLCDRMHFKPVQSGYEWLCEKLISSTFRVDKRVPDDVKAVSEALYLRSTFAFKNNLSAMDSRGFYRSLGPCTVLEIVAVLVEKMSFLLNANLLASNYPACLFFELMDNIGLSYLNDDCFEDEEGDEIADEIINTFVERTYDWSGEGGLFPLENAPEDMRYVDLLRQLDLYLIERYEILD